MEGGRVPFLDGRRREAVTEPESQVGFATHSAHDRLAFAQRIWEIGLSLGARRKGRKEWTADQWEIHPRLVAPTSEILLFFEQAHALRTCVRGPALEAMSVAPQRGASWESCGVDGDSALAASGSVSGSPKA